MNNLMNKMTILRSNIGGMMLPKIRDDSTHGSIFLANIALDVVEEFVQEAIVSTAELIQALSKLRNALVRTKR